MYIQIASKCTQNTFCTSADANTAHGHYQTMCFESTPNTMQRLILIYCVDIQCAMAVQIKSSVYAGITQGHTHVHAHTCEQPYPFCVRVSRQRTLFHTGTMHMAGPHSPRCTNTQSNKRVHTPPTRANIL